MMTYQQAEDFFALHFPSLAYSEEDRLEPVFGQELMELGIYITKCLESKGFAEYTVDHISTFFTKILDEGEELVVDSLYSMSLLDQMLEEEYFCLFKDIYKREDVQRELKSYYSHYYPEFDYDLHLLLCEEGKGASA